MSENIWGNVCGRVDTCALTGAAAFFAGIPGAEILANGPLWCYFYALRHLEHAQCDMARRFHGSQPDNSAVVYGTEKFLLEALDRLLSEGRRPDIMLVENSCSLSLIGDDLKGIIRKAGVNFPVTVMDCGGLMGGFAEGYAKAQLELFRYLEFADAEPEPLTVNLLGATEFYFNGHADVQEIIRLLELCGVRVNAVPGCGSRLADIKKLRRACLNIVLNAELGLEAAVYLHQEMGMPYVNAGLPYGTEGTLAWIRRINELLGADLKPLEEEAAGMQSFLASWNNETRCGWGNMWFDRVIVSAPGTAAVCIADTLRREWLDTGRMTVVCQQEAAGMRSGEADETLLAGRDYERIDEALRTLGSGLLLGSSSESSLLRRYGCSRASSCNVAFPVKDELLLTDVPFCGLKGSAHMLQRLWNTFIRSRECHD